MLLNKIPAILYVARICDSYDTFTVGPVCLSQMKAEAFSGIETFTPASRFRMRFRTVSKTLEHELSKASNSFLNLIVYLNSGYNRISRVRFCTSFAFILRVLDYSYRAHELYECARAHSETGRDSRTKDIHYYFWTKNIKPTS